MERTTLMSSQPWGRRLEVEDNGDVTIVSSTGSHSLLLEHLAANGRARFVENGDLGQTKFSKY